MKIHEIQWNYKYMNSISKKKTQVPPVLNTLFKMKSFANLIPSKSDRRTLLDRKKDLIAWWEGNRLGLIYPLLISFGLSEGRKSKQQILEEQKIIRILMKEGNFKPEDDIHNGGMPYTESFFQFFIRLNNPHLALAILPLKKLNVSQKEVDSTYRYISDHLKEESPVFSESKRLHKTLVYELFKKDMIPSNKECFAEMAQIVHQQDNTFFEKVKRKMIDQLTHAKTPIQIYNALMGKRKEKN